MRSATYQAATSSQRRQTHQALAAALGEAGDDDRAVWHRAAAADGREEAVALALAEVGARAENRGGYAAASSAYERAAQLSAEPPTRARLLYAAARNAWACGQAGRASTLAAGAREEAEDRLLLADINRLRGRVEVNVGSTGAAHRILVQGAQAVLSLDPTRALEMAAAAALLHGYGADSGTSVDPSTILAAVGPDDQPRIRCLSRLLVATTRADAEEWGTAVVALSEAARAGRDVDDLDLRGNLGNAALHLGDDRMALRCYTAMLSSARESGAGMGVIYALPRLGFAQFVAGQWAGLRAGAEEALTLSRSVGQPALTAAPLAWLTVLAALQGRPDYAARLAELDGVVDRHPLGVLTDPVHDLTQWAMGAQAAQAGDPATALRHFARLRVATLRRMSALERIEAAVRAGEAGRARGWVEELARFAAATGWPWAQRIVDFGRAITAGPPEESSVHFDRALAHRDPGSPGLGEGSSGRPYDQARVHLAYGEWLRRNQRRVDARAHLRYRVGDLHRPGRGSARCAGHRGTAGLRGAGPQA